MRLRDVPILRGAQYLDGERLDLDDVVRDFAAGGMKPPLVSADPVLAHQHTGQPALGWCTQLRRDGDAVLATFTDVVPCVAAAFREGGGDCRGLFVRRDGRWCLHSVRLTGVALPRVDTLDGLHGVLLDARAPHPAAPVRFAAPPPSTWTRRNRCPTCGETQSCVPMKYGGFACTVCVAHTGESDHRYGEEGTTMREPERIDLDEEIAWANRRRVLWNAGQRTDHASAAAFVGSLLERARLRAFQGHLREVASTNGLDLRDYKQRSEAAALCLDEEPDWRNDRWVDLNPRLQATISRHYETVKRAEDLKAAQRERAVPATRPDPDAAARDRAVAGVAARLGVDPGTSDGLHAAVDQLAREQPSLVPRYGRSAEVTSEDANALRSFREATVRVLTERRARAAEPPPAPQPPVGGYWY